MTEETRHAAGGMMLSQSVGGQDKRKSRIARRREAIFLAGEPIDYGVRVARIESIFHRRLERFVVRRHRSVLQTLWHMKPSESVFMQDEGRIAANCIESALIPGWSKLRRLFDRKIRLIAARPFALLLVPPDQLLPFA